MPTIREGEQNLQKWRKNTHTALEQRNSSVPRNHVVFNSVSICMRYIFIRIYTFYVLLTRLISVGIETLHFFMSIHWFDFHVIMIFFCVILSLSLSPFVRSVYVPFLFGHTFTHFRQWEGVEKLMSPIDLLYIFLWKKTIINSMAKRMWWICFSMCACIDFNLFFEIGAPSSIINTIQEWCENTTQINWSNPK